MKPQISQEEEFDRVLKRYFAISKETTYLELLKESNKMHPEYDYDM